MRKPRPGRRARGFTLTKTIAEKRDPGRAILLPARSSAPGRAAPDRACRAGRSGLRHRWRSCRRAGLASRSIICLRSPRAWASSREMPTRSSISRRWLLVSSPDRAEVAEVALAIGPARAADEGPDLAVEDDAVAGAQGKVAKQRDAALAGLDDGGPAGSGVSRRLVAKRHGQCAVALAVGRLGLGDVGDTCGHAENLHRDTGVHCLAERFMGRQRSPALRNWPIGAWKPSQRRTQTVRVPSATAASRASGARFAPGAVRHRPPRAGGKG